MWLVIAIVLLVASCINGNIDMLQASGMFAVAAAVSELAYKIKWKG